MNNGWHKVLDHTTTTYLGPRRCVHWRDEDGWTVSYLYQGDQIIEVWVWDVEEKKLTPNPVGVFTAEEAAEVVRKALGDPVPAP